MKKKKLWTFVHSKGDLINEKEIKEDEDGNDVIIDESKLKRNS